MSIQPEIYLHDLSPDERTKLTSMGRAVVIRKGMLFIPPALVIAAGLIYVNINLIPLKLDNSSNTVGAINVVLVIGIALMLRMFVTYVINFSKESKAWQKKVVQGKIHGKKGNTVYIGRQTVKLDPTSAAQVNVEDDVEISLSLVSGFVLGLVKRNAQS